MLPISLRLSHVASLLRTSTAAAHCPDLFFLSPDLKKIASSDRPTISLTHLLYKLLWYCSILVQAYSRKASEFAFWAHVTNKVVSLSAFAVS